ncbi:hypothetical protein GCM10027567_05360 [Spongiibacter taiwanensis]
MLFELAELMPLLFHQTSQLHHLLTQLLKLLVKLPLHGGLIIRRAIRTGTNINYRRLGTRQTGPQNDTYYEGSFPELHQTAFKSLISVQHDGS